MLDISAKEQRKTNWTKTFVVWVVAFCLLNYIYTDEPEAKKKLNIYTVEMYQCKGLKELKQKLKQDLVKNSWDVGNLAAC